MTISPHLAEEVQEVEVVPLRDLAVAPTILEISNSNMCLIKAVTSTTIIHKITHNTNNMVKNTMLMVKSNITLNRILIIKSNPLITLNSSSSSSLTMSIRERAINPRVTKNHQSSHIKSKRLHTPRSSLSSSNLPRVNKTAINQSISLRSSNINKRLTKQRLNYHNSHTGRLLSITLLQPLSKRITKRKSSILSTSQKLKKVIIKRRMNTYLRHPKSSRLTENQSQNT